MPTSNYPHIITLLFLLLLSVGSIIGQACISTDTIIIVDDDKANINFTVEGVTLDNLAAAEQCVKSVSLKFSHGGIADLRVSLISPAGQSIQLVGPVGTSSNTQLVTWDVSFIPCAEPALPDIGITDTVWSNNADWRTLENYNGSYYPFGGCLEEFLMGPVNGIWTVEIADEIPFDAGIIEFIGIEFCDESGIGCAPCMASAGEFENSLDTTICVFNNNLLLDFLDIEGATDPADPNYRYEFVIADEFNREIFDISAAPDIRAYGAADFEICGLSYDASFESVIREMVSIGDLDDFKRFIDQVPSTICADITAQCMKVKTLNIIDTLVIDTIICAGSIFEFSDEAFFEVGQALVPFGRGLCDSIAKISIEVIEMEAIIGATAPALSCDIDTIVLGGDRSVVTPDFGRLWSGPQGGFSGPPSGPQIKVFQPGTYQLIVFNQAGCADTTSVDIVNDIDELLISEIESSGFLTCAEPQVSLQVLSDEVPDRVEWTGPDGYSSDELSPSVGMPGTYIATIFAPNGCPSSDSIIVEKDSSTIRYNFDLDTLSCMIKEVNITFNDNVFPIDPLWISPSGVEYPELSPLVNEAGIFNFVSSSINGCRDTQLYEVVLFSETYSLDFEEATLSCANDSVNIKALSENDILNYQWSGPDEFISLDESPIIKIPGIYTVRTLDADNCPGLDSFEVRADTLAPMIALIGDNLQCLDTSTVLNLIIDDNSASFSWSGPDSFMSIDNSITVSAVGAYVVNAAGENGCTSTDTFNLMRVPPFEVDIADNEFDCDFTPISIMASAPADILSVTWDGPNSFAANTLNPMISDTGLYNITVIGSDACEVRDSVYIGIPESSILISNVKDTVFTCEIIDITLMPQVSAGVADAVWVTPSLDRLLELNPNVTEPGIYQLEVRDDQGCVSDTSLMIGLDTMKPVINTSIIGGFVCDRNQVTIDGSGSAAGSDILYQWTTNNGNIDGVSNANSIDITSPGTYNFNVLNLNNFCGNLQTIQIDEQENQFTDADISVQSESCLDAEDGSIMVLSTDGAADGALRLSLDNQVFIETTVLDAIDPGMYTLYIKDINGCTLEKPIVIDQAAEVSVSIGEDLLGFAGEPFTVGVDVADLSPSDIIWSVDGESIATGVDSVELSTVRDVMVMVEIVTEDGCRISDVISVEVDERKVMIYSPNVFMPGSGENGTFRVFANQAASRIDDFQIFDKWGNQVYTETNIDPREPYGWDGTFNGDEAEIGVYAYEALVFLTNGKTRQLAGSITLVR